MLRLVEAILPDPAKNPPHQENNQERENDLRQTEPHLETKPVPVEPLLNSREETRAKGK